MRRILLTLLISACSLTVFAQSQIYETKKVQSSILGMDRNYSIYLPDGYDRTDRSYPVLYLLHGLSDNHTGWVQFGKVQQIADKAIKEGLASEMIIVMPDADTKMPGYFNEINGTYNYEDFFFKELIPHIEKTYRVRPERRYRAIAGLSMGGGGTLYYALHHPEMFAAACPMSGYFGASSIDEMKESSGRSPLTPKVSTLSDEKIAEYFTNHNAAAYLESVPEQKLDEIEKVRWYITCGDDDFLIRSNNQMYNTLLENGISAEYRVKDGAHTWSYWRGELPIILEFVSRSFSQY